MDESDYDQQKQIYLQEKTKKTQDKNYDEFEALKQKYL